MQKTTRRTFVKGTAAAAVPLFIPATVLGRQGAISPNEQITVGHIGVGKMGGYHVDRFTHKRNGTRVLAICDVDTTRREYWKSKVEERQGKCATYIDYRELLARKDIDAVCIATPDHWHAAPAIEACIAGKDIYCEKPLTLTIEEAKRLIDATRKYKRVFQTGSQQRSGREFRTACEYVRNGRLGKITHVEVNVGGPSKWCDLKEEKMEPGLNWERWLGQAPERPYNSILSPRGIHRHFPRWRSYREFSGGSMTDWGAHHFDIAQWGLGMDESGPVEITPPEKPERGKGVVYTYADGVRLIHGGGGGVTFHGPKGTITVNRGKLKSDPESILKEPLGDKAVRLYASPGHHADFVRCIKTRKRPICDVEIGARSVTVCHLGNLAYWYGRKLKWDPQKWEFPGDAEANGWRTRERRDPYTLPRI